MYLNCHSYYSLRYGMLSIASLVQKAKEKGVRKLALTDINNSTGALEFVKQCKAQNIEPIVGIEFREQDELKFVGLARNAKGFAELNEHLTKVQIEKHPIKMEQVNFLQVHVIYPLKSFRDGDISLDSLKGNEYIGIGLKDLNKIRFAKKEERKKMILMQTVSFAHARDWHIHKRLRAIDQNSLLSKLNEENIAHPEECFLEEGEVYGRLALFPEVLENTKRVLYDCSFDFDFIDIKNKKTYTSSAQDDKELLHKLAMDGMEYRYGKGHKEALQRVENELDIIDRLGFSSYFLITWDIIRYSMNRGFYHVGRGSGANSVVAYCLKITDVCPIELDLYFERFLNPKRKTPPDFDIDYSWKERDEVLEYIFKRYGNKHTALLGTMTTFKDRSIVRELGKVYGLPKEEIDLLIHKKYRKQDSNKDSIVKEILYIENYIKDFPNSRSIHAGGVLISEEPLYRYTALDMPPKGLQTVQFDMYLAEDIGFEKLDILSQRGIGHIKEAAEIIYRNRGMRVDVHDVKRFKKDAQVAKQLKLGDTIGCFYIESPAMRGLLKKLKCEDYLTLVAASSIIRPGVAKSGMMKAYIERYHDPSKVKYLHPVMEEQLQETYGVMVYQEDVLKVGHHFGGLDLADADVLRRLMSGKNRGQHHLVEIKDKFFKNTKEKGYDSEVVNEVWRQIESFAGYSFSKAHSASYAVESYQSLYLKAHFPLEFMVAVINNFGGFYSRWVYFNEARRAGGNILLPCVNKSTYFTNIEGKDIYIGFVHIENLEQKIAQRIELERARNGMFEDLQDFIQRIPIGIEQVLILIRLNAFRFSKKSKKTLLWEAHMLMGKSVEYTESLELFAMEAKDFDLPPLVESKIEDAYDEIELIGFPVSLSAFDLLQSKERLDLRANNLMEHLGKEIKIMGNFVAAKLIKTSSGKLMAFGTFIDEDGNFFDTVNFPPSLERYPFQGSGVYLILGKVVEDFGFPSIEVVKMAKLGLMGNPIAV